MVTLVSVSHAEADGIGGRIIGTTKRNRLAALLVVIIRVVNFVEGQNQHRDIKFEVL